MAEPDLSEFDKEAAGRKYTCNVALLPLSPEQRAKLDAALARPGEYTVTGIVRVLHTWGCSIAETTVSHHRLKRCACVRKP